MNWIHYEKRKLYTIRNAGPNNTTLQFLTPLMLCMLILYISVGTYNLKSTPNDRFFEKLFMAIWFTLRVFARNPLRGNRRRNTFCILFCCLAWDSNPGFSSNKPTHYLLDHGDFDKRSIEMVITGNAECI